MEWVFDNPLANLRGPEFLMLYGFVVACLIIGGWWFVRTLDVTDGERVPRLPVDPDPYQIAYLRGDIQELARVLVLSLVERGRLIRPEDKKLALYRRPGSSSAGLSEVERIADEWFDEEREAPEIFKKHGLVTRLEPQAAKYSEELQAAGLLLPDSARATGSFVRYLGSAAIFGLSFYKLIAAHLHGKHNVTFLILMTFVGWILFLIMTRLSRLTRSGSAYLARLQQTFASLRSKLQSPPPNLNPTPWMSDADAAVSHSPRLSPVPLLLGVFGTTVLAETALADYQTLFPRAISTGGSCGSSCGSSCGGGGGCGGGGCGGCGGGGD